MSILSRITRGIGFGALAVAELGLIADAGGTKFAYPRRPRWATPDPRWGVDHLT